MEEEILLHPLVIVIAKAIKAKFLKRIGLSIWLNVGAMNYIGTPCVSGNLCETATGGRRSVAAPA